MVFMGWGLVFCLPSGAVGQESPQDPFTEESLNLRAALHSDTAQGTPLDALVRLYSKAGREEELIGLYEVHLTKYPLDPKAKAVLYRVLVALQRPEADKFIQAAAQQHPEFAHLQYLLSKNLERKDEVRSLEALSRAIDLETGSNRRRDWLGELLERSKTEKGRELSDAQLRKLLLMDGQTGQNMLQLGSVMQRYEFWELSLQALEKALTLKLLPDEEVEAAVLAAKSQAALGLSEKAGQRLDKVLARLGPDHHRRAEIMRQRIGVVASDEQRLALLARALDTYTNNPRKETAVLDYAEILDASGRTAEAVKILIRGAVDLPDSGRIEKFAISLLEKQKTPRDLIRFLGSRLELHPERSDLRYRLVKAHYEVDDTRSASQDFQLVLAGLGQREKVDRILDLGRYLRSTGKRALAARQFEDFLKLEPIRLDVTRELAEVYLEDGLESKVTELLAQTSPKSVTEENVLDLAQFLIGEEFFGPAERLLEDYLNLIPRLAFEPGLALARVLGELGKETEAAALVLKLREQTDTLARYRQWLDASLLIYENFEKVSEFFDGEQRKFQFVEAEWNLERIEKFLYLCEAGERRQLTDRVVGVIRQRLNSGTLEPSMAIRLRALLARALEQTPGAENEVEQQLQLLTKEDVENANDYELRRALLYYRVQRPDLAAAVVDRLDLSKVNSAKLLRDSYSILRESGDSGLVGSALARVTSLEPGDLFSWEKWLSLLAAKGEEDRFREAIRSLLQGIAQHGKGVEWREDSKRALRSHLLDSYWRSIAKIIARGNHLAEAMPLLDSVAREAQGQDLLWVDWARAYLFRQLGRLPELDAALENLRLRHQREGDLSIHFPDGLSTPLALAIEAFSTSQTETEGETASPILPLLERPQIKWAFETDTTLARMGATGDAVLALDQWGQVYRIHSQTGKQVWKKNYGVSPLPVMGAGMASGSESKLANARLIRDWHVDENRFVLAFGNELRAYSAVDGSLLWKNQANETSRHSAETVAVVGAVPSLRFAAEGSIVVAFDPVAGHLSAYFLDNGKLLWEEVLETIPGRDERKLLSINTGISISGGRILVYGDRAAIFELATGRLLWNFAAEEARVFPVALREQREDLSEEELVTLEQTTPQPVWAAGSQGRELHLNHLDDRTVANDGGLMSFLKYPGRLVAPAVVWSEDRVLSGEAAMGRLSPKELWLMDRSGIQLINLALPLGSRHYSERGLLLGESGSNAWIIKDGSIVHIDGSRDTVSYHSLENLGAELSGTLIGKWVYVRGREGVSVYNAISGKRISSGQWDPLMKEFLAGLPVSPAGSVVTWQGEVRSEGTDQPTWCYPPLNLSSNGNFYTAFQSRHIVSISD